ncbi:amino acid permease [Spiroplasma turonicum]|uniref:Amino acid permease family protein n=1 Tax=Spiroplasma turonicum TaxID=216946 RepID=A0A0K1P652_9MOLU|nr:amino acid permease [Spiroplasma turonicum]AKU79745.1 amino acid permease family protein [Spiroplasma turonicum]ALX70763.1 amino acid permease family protein [Spiroplasma turonicum]
MSNRVKSLTKISIFLMSFSTIFGFRNIINNQNQFGILAAILFLVGGAIYAIPLVMITSEFGSVKKLKDQESGLGSFCVFTLGKKAGFLASWSSYFGNLFFFATIAPFTVIALSFFFYGANGFDQIAKILVDNSGLSTDNSTRVGAITLTLFSIILFWTGSYVSKKGPKWLGKVTNIGGIASLLLGLIFIIIALLYTLPTKGILTNMNSSSFNPITDEENGFDGDWWSFIGAFPWLIFAYNGIETMSVFIKDTKGGAKTFRNASLIGIILVVFLMFMGTILLSLTISQSQITKWGISNSYYYVFPAILGLDIDSGGGKAIIHIVGLVTALNGIGSLFFWTSAPAKVFFSEVPENVMGKFLSKTDKNGTPVNALYIQAIVVAIILLIVGATTTGDTDQGSSEFLTRIIQSATTLAIVQMFFYFVAYIKLRINFNDEERDIIFFKNKKIPITISIITLVLLGIAFFFGVIPSVKSWQTDWVKSLIDFLFIFGGFVFFIIVAILVWHFNVERKNKLINKKTQIESITNDEKNIDNLTVENKDRKYKKNK